MFCNTEGILSCDYQGLVYDTEYYREAWWCEAVSCGIHCDSMVVLRAIGTAWCDRIRTDYERLSLLLPSRSEVVEVHVSKKELILSLDEDNISGK